MAISRNVFILSRPREIEAFVIEVSPHGERTAPPFRATSSTGISPPPASTFIEAISLANKSASAIIPSIVT